MSTSRPPEDARIRRILDARTEELAQRAALGDGAADAASAPSVPMLVCAAGGERYGLALASVAAVLPFRPCAPAPGAHPAALGLFGRAGALYQALDLAGLLGLSVPTPGDADPGHLVVLRREAPRTALRVDRVLGTAPAVVGEAEAAANSLLGNGPVIGYARAPAGTLGADETGFALLDLDRLLQPLAPPPASGA